MAMAEMVLQRQKSLQVPAETKEAGVDTISNAAELALTAGVLAEAAADSNREEMALWWDVPDDL